jgi:hypothetical protein
VSEDFKATVKFWKFVRVQTELPIRNYLYTIIRLSETVKRIVAFIEFRYMLCQSTRLENIVFKKIKYVV